MPELTRRDFLKSAGALGTTVVLAQTLLPLIKDQPKSTPSTEKTPKLIPTVCGMCNAQCGILVYTLGEKVLKIEGNYDHSHSLGKICPRGSAGVELLYSEQRLKVPLKRAPDGKFNNISWEQATAEVGARLSNIKKKYGPEALAWVFHPRLSQAWDKQFMKAFGSPNIFTTRSICSNDLEIACQHTLGGVPVPDLANAEYIVIFGANPAESIFISDLWALMQAKEKGAHLVVVDPRLSRTAAQAHEWLPIRPGTDGALLLALINVLVTENLYDAGFIANYTTGFDKLKTFIADSSPGWASAITGVPVDIIRRLARELAAAKPAAMVVMGRHSPSGAMYTNGLQTARAALILNALLGNYDVKGGMIIPSKFQVEPKLPETPPVLGKRADGAGDKAYPLASSSDGIVQLLPDIILSEKPYPIKALIVNGSNLVQALPNTSKVIKALQKLELLVVIDIQGTETGELAHYILPESTYLERFDPVVATERLIPEIALRQPVVAPIYDTKPAYEIIAGLAQETEIGAYFPASLEEVVRRQLRPFGLSLEEMQRSGVWREIREPVSGKRQFKTKSGKVELFLDSFKAAGVDALPTYKPPSVQGGNGSFRLLHGREAVHTGSATQNIGWLNALKPENELWLNADVAARMALADGDRVRVKSEAGEVTVKARVTSGIHPEAVFLIHGFGHNTRWQRLAWEKGANDNNLILDRLEPVTGTAALCETLVTVAREK